MFALLPWSTLYFSALVAAQDSHTSLVGWQSDNDQRSTWDIVSTCLLTIFACTWSIQHLNVPGSRRAKRSWLFVRSMKWMVITILFPELIVIHAIFELAMALQALTLMEKTNRLVEKPWWLQPPSELPRYLSRSKERPEDADSEKQSVDDQTWTLTHCYFANMGGFYFKASGDGNVSFPMTALQLADEPWSAKIRLCTRQEIEDRSKSDWFAKLVATLGFLQLALSLIVRKSRGLAFSQLETITLVFAVCGVVIYLLYFYKPQKVETSVVIENVLEGVEVAPRYFTEQPFSRSMSGGRRETQTPIFKKTYDSFWDVLSNKSSYASHQKGKSSPGVPDRIPNDNIPISDSSIAHPGVLVLALASGLFGAMHAIAWNFEFPSTVEKLLWQVATVVGAVSPFFGLVTIPFAQWIVSAGDPQLFAENCLRLVREYSWQARCRSLAERAYNKLEDAVSGKGPHQAYKNVFLEQRGAQTFSLIPELLNLVKVTGRYSHLDKTQMDLHSDSQFIGDLELLDRQLNGEMSKKLGDTAATNTFPQKNLLPRSLNLGILYVTGTLYLLSRISLLAIGFSSLRQMPDSVYQSIPWMQYIPTLGSS